MTRTATTADDTSRGTGPSGVPPRDDGRQHADDERDQQGQRDVEERAAQHDHDAQQPVAQHADRDRHRDEGVRDDEQQLRPGPHGDQQHGDHAQQPEQLLALGRHRTDRPDQGPHRDAHHGADHQQERRHAQDVGGPDRSRPRHLRARHGVVHAAGPGGHGHRRQSDPEQRQPHVPRPVRAGRASCRVERRQHERGQQQRRHPRPRRQPGRRKAQGQRAVGVGERPGRVGVRGEVGHLQQPGQHEQPADGVARAQVDQQPAGQREARDEERDPEVGSLGDHAGTRHHAARQRERDAGQEGEGECGERPPADPPPGVRARGSHGHSLLRTTRPVPGRLSRSDREVLPGRPRPLPDAPTAGDRCAGRTPPATPKEHP